MKRLALVIALALIGCSHGQSAIMQTPQRAQNEVTQTNPSGKWRFFTVSNSDADIVVGADKNLWFSDPAHQMVGRITMDGTITEFPIAGSNYPMQMTLGPDKNIWITDDIGGIYKVDTSGNVTAFASPQADAIAAGPDGNVWFCEPTASAVGRITPDGTVTSFPIGDPTMQCSDITKGGDGNLWFTVSNGTTSGIDKMTPQGNVTAFSIPPPGNPNQTLIGAQDGNVWFVGDDNEIHKITSTGVVSTITSPYLTHAEDLDRGPGQTLAILGINRIDFVSMAGVYSPQHAIPFPSREYSAMRLVTGPDQNIWFTYVGPSRGIGVYVRNVMGTTPSFVSVSAGQSATVTVTQSGYHGPWTATSSNTSIATVVQGKTASTFTVTGVTSGTCSVTIADSHENTIPVTVSVQ